MSILTVLVRRIQSLAQLIDNPKLFRLRQQGGYPSVFCDFNKPWFYQIGIKTVLDIGANRGQFSKTIYALLPLCDIYAFEPIPDCYQSLQVALPQSSSFHAFNIGIGEESGNLTFQVNDFSPASSFLEISDEQKKTFPKTQNSKSLQVRIERLDDAVANILIQEPLFIKIDVQGYEDRVLAGGENTIRKAKLIMVETSFKGMYKGQVLFDGLYQWLTSRGFTYIGSMGQLENDSTGAFIQADALFLRDGL
jgi:FkbM family methyltransferase